MGAFPASRAFTLSTEPISAAVPETAPSMAAPVPSPCVSLCKMDMERRYCLGCRRTIAEIVAWGKADDDYKRAVWAELRHRAPPADLDAGFD